MPNRVVMIMKFVMCHDDEQGAYDMLIRYNLDQPSFCGLISDLRHCFVDNDKPVVPVEDGCHG